MCIKDCLNFTLIPWYSSYDNLVINKYEFELLALLFIWQKGAQIMLHLTAIKSCVPTTSKWSTYFSFMVTKWWISKWKGRIKINSPSISECGLHWTTGHQLIPRSHIDKLPWLPAPSTFWSSSIVRCLKSRDLF